MLQGVAIVDISEIDGLKVIKEISKSFESNRFIFIKTDITKGEELEG